jgi:hypothetical protein
LKIRADRVDIAAKRRTRASGRPRRICGLIRARKDCTTRIQRVTYTDAE